MNILSNRALGAYLSLAGAVLSLLSLVLYFLYGNLSGERNMLIILPLIILILLAAAGLVSDNDYLALVTPAVAVIPLCALLMDSVYTFVGYFFRLDMFGDVTLMGDIVRLCAIMGINTVLLLVSCFLRRGQVQR